MGYTVSIGLQPPEVMPRRPSAWPGQSRRQVRAGSTEELCVPTAVLIPWGGLSGGSPQPGQASFLFRSPLVSLGTLDEADGVESDPQHPQLSEGKARTPEPRPHGAQVSPPSPDWRSGHGQMP